MPMESGRGSPLGAGKGAHVSVDVYKLVGSPKEREGVHVFAWV